MRRFVLPLIALTLILLVSSACAAADPALRAVALAASAGTMPPVAEATSDEDPAPVSTLPDVQRRILLNAVAVTLNNNYPDLSGEEPDWTALAESYEPRILAATSDAEVYALINEMLAAAGDEHAYLLTPAETAAEDAIIAEASRFSGIGTSIDLLEETLLVQRTVPGGPAATAGIQAGDRIVAVDGVPAAELAADGRIAAAVRSIRGETGTDVVLTVLAPDDSERTVTVRRGPIDMSQASPLEAMLLPGTDVGYILPFWLDASILGQAIQDLSDQTDLAGLIIDLRRRPDGTVAEVVDAIGLFGGGESMGRLGDQDLIIPDQRLEAVADVPVALLIDARPDGGAGAVFAAGMGELALATLVGEATGATQPNLISFDLPQNTRLYLPQEPLRYPDGTPLYEVGVTPDVVVDGDWWRHADLLADPQVQAALEVVQE